ncbi:MAG: hypothetical protein Fur006_06130 [Coleofasciculaceae cyanobacterium]
MDNQALSVQSVDSRSLRTRITLYDVMDYVRAEYPPKFTRGMLNLTDEQVNAALSYIEANRAEVEAEYQIVLQEQKKFGSIGKNAIANGLHKSRHFLQNLDKKQFGRNSRRGKKSLG